MIGPSTTGTASCCRFRRTLCETTRGALWFSSKTKVLDPFCGTGTTLVECKKLGVPSLGVEANPMAHFASEVKVDWDCNPDRLITHAEELASRVAAELRDAGINDDCLPLFNYGRASANLGGATLLRTLEPGREALLLGKSISPRPLHKTLLLLDRLAQDLNAEGWRHEMLAPLRPWSSRSATYTLAQKWV